WTNAFPGGVCTIETTGVVPGGWVAGTNYFTSNSVGGATVVLSASNLFVRVLAVDISTNTPAHFTNLINSYGLLETIAGKYVSTGSMDKVNYWRPAYEGGFATNAVLSRPHIAISNPRDDSVLIVDEGSSSILKVTPEGRIFTYAGTHTNG